ncbi:hypothetical protein T484DRAFT_3095130 [Baffinella frigidus]|nr:hypothetical protein T484DRAFT_3095130 [Cryptophyta sp. CCMP2293]
MGIVRPTLLVLLFAAPATCFLTPALLTARSGLHPVDAALAPRLGRSSGIPRQGKEALRCAVGPESERDAGEATAAGHRWSGATGGVQGRRALMRGAMAAGLAVAAASPALADLELTPFAQKVRSLGVEVET